MSGYIHSCGLSQRKFVAILSKAFLPYCIYFQHASLKDIQKNIRELELDDNRKKELVCALHAQFKDWLYGNLLIYR